mgnify:CR=1 FL=1
MFPRMRGMPKRLPAIERHHIAAVESYGFGFKVEHTYLLFLCGKLGITQEQLNLIFQRYTGQPVTKDIPGFDSSSKPLYRWFHS